MRRVDLPTDQLRAEIEDSGIGWLIYDNPERHNAVNGAMLDALPTACRALDTDPDVRVVVLRGGGDRSFVSGGDLKEMHHRVESGQRVRTPADQLFEAIGASHLLAIEKPVIAMVRGWCLGGGLLTALCAALRIASDTAVVGIPAARLGVGYPHEAVAALAAVVGPARAAEILFTGDRFDAATAASWGLLNRVVPDGDLDDEVRRVAATLAANAPLSILAAKASLRALAGRLEVADAHAAIAAAWASSDMQEGPRAFAERRPPRFTGR